MRCIRLSPLLFSLLLPASAQNSTAEIGKPDFIRDVQPVLTERCMPCHSGNEAQSGLQVHTRDQLLRGGKSGPAIIPGNGAGSLLIVKMQGKQGMRMPP